MDIKIEDYLDEQEIKEICKDALTVPVRKRTRGYRPSASCGAKMDGGENNG